jgi:hypothetical protein
VKWCLAVLLMCACGPGVAPAKVWTARDYYEQHEIREPRFGGWSPYELARLPGELTLFTQKATGADAGLSVFPVLIGGQPTGMVILDIWQDHPAPWVQPVYSPSTVQNGVLLPIDDAFSVFPVGIDSSFYSAWWQQHLVPMAADGTTLTSARDALARNPVVTNEVVLCPLVPTDTGVALEGDGAAREPIAQTRLEVPEVANAFVDGRQVHYLALGANRIRASGQTLEAGDLYLWVDGDVPLPVAAVGPRNRFNAGLVRRVEVQVPPGAAFFVPDNRPELRRAFANEALVPPVAVALNVHQNFALRLTLNAECLTPAAFASCRWVSTAAEVLQLPSGLLRRRPVLASLGILERVP